MHLYPESIPQSNNKPPVRPVLRMRTRSSINKKTGFDWLIEKSLSNDYKKFYMTIGWTLKPLMGLNLTATRQLGICWKSQWPWLTSHFKPFERIHIQRLSDGRSLEGFIPSSVGHVTKWNIYVWSRWFHDWGIYNKKIKQVDSVNSDTRVQLITRASVR